MADKTVDQVEKNEQRRDGLEALTLPAGIYARMTVRPWLKCLWGPAIGAAKRFFYTRWLPGSFYGAMNMEYEHHTEKSIGRHPEIELFFAVEKKTETGDRHGTAKQ